MTIKADHQLALNFLRSLYPQGPWILCAIHPTKRNPITGDAETKTRTFTDIEYARAFLKQFGEWNLYYSVNPTVAPVEKKPERHEIKAVHYLQVDLDPLPGETPSLARQRILPKLEHPPGGLLLPTTIVWSGNGGQALWGLVDPPPIQGESRVEREASADREKGRSHQIELIMGGADATHNVDRIMRLPGTLNWPTQKKIDKYGRTDPVLAELILFDDSRRYRADQFVCLTPATSVPRASVGGPTRHGYSAGGNIERFADLSTLDLTRLKEIGRDPDAVILTINTGQPPEEFAQKWGGDRSKMVLWVCCELVRANVSDDKIYSIITDPAFPISAHVLDQRSGVKRYAERQIDRAHDMAVHEDLAWVNERYAAIEDVGGKCAIIKELLTLDLHEPTVSYKSPSDFREFFANRYVTVKKKQVDKKGNIKEVEDTVELGTWWWKHPMRRQFDRVVFEPERKIPGAYNLWRGFGVDPVPGDWSIFKQLMLDNLCRGNEAHYDYLIRAVAHWFQHPGEQGWVAIVLQGAQGTGKGTFAHTLGKLWGRHYYHLIDGRHLVGQFTGHLRDKLMVFADEAFFAGDYQAESKIKGLVTEQTINIEDKYVRTQSFRNYLKILIASNKKWVIRAEETDRRYYVLDALPMAAREVEKLRVAIDAQMEAGGLGGLLYDLLHMDLSGFNIRHIPQTEALAQQKELSMSTEQTWWANKLYSGELIGDHFEWTKPLPCKLLTDDYYNYHQRSRSNGRPLPESVLGRFIQDSVPVEQGRTLRVNDDGRAKYRFPPLRACREHWEKIINAKLSWPAENTRADAAGKFQTDIPHAATAVEPPPIDF